MGTPGTPIAHAHTPINNLMNQMNSMNLGTPGTPQPPHPQSQQMMGPWSTPDHNQPTGKNLKFSKKIFQASVLKSLEDLLVHNESAMQQHTTV